MSSACRLFRLALSRSSVVSHTKSIISEVERKHFNIRHLDSTISSSISFTKIPLIRLKTIHFSHAPDLYRQRTGNSCHELSFASCSRTARRSVDGFVYGGQWHTVPSSVSFNHDAETTSTSFEDGKTTTAYIAWFCKAFSNQTREHYLN